MSKDLVAGGLASAVGGMGLLIALAFLAERGWFLSRAEAAPGKVVAMERGRWSMDRRTRFPVVEFAARDGRTYRAEGASGRPPRHFLGNPVRVYYLPNDPESARLDDPLELWLAPGASGAVGGLLFALGVVILLGARKRQRLELLRTTGIRLRGTVVHVADSSLRSWGKALQILTVEAVDPQSGVPRRFTSHRVPGQGTEWLGKTLHVFVDKSSPARYLVDAVIPDCICDVRTQRYSLERLE